MEGRWWTTGPLVVVEEAQMEGAVVVAGKPEIYGVVAQGESERLRRSGVGGGGVPLVYHWW